ncbi:MAG: beta-propeller fold lactonase family protein [Myxococcota bacterium]
MDSDTDGAGETGEAGETGDPDPGSATTINPTDAGGSESGMPDDDGAPDDGNDDPEPDSDTDDDDGDTGEPVDGEAGMVFTLSNPDGPNSVVAFVRDPEGALWELGDYATGGMGSGGPLGSQGSIGHHGEHLYVVNPGDGTVSSLRIYDDHLGLEDIQASGGARPTSLAVNGEHLYVLNAEGAGGVVGFEIDDGTMSPIAGASQPLSGAEMPAPAQVAITPAGDYVVVTERATNQIVTYAVHEDGSLDAPVVNPASGVTPFGFAFRNDGVLIVTEAFGGGMNPGASAASSHRVADGGGLWTFEGSVPSGQTAACWVSLADNYAYTSNTGSNTISAYHVEEEGDLTLFANGGVVADLGDDHGPIDMAVGGASEYLYVLNRDADVILGFSIDEGGTLTELEGAHAVPAAAAGMLGY